MFKNLLSKLILQLYARLVKFLEICKQIFTGKALKPARVAVRTKRKPM